MLRKILPYLILIVSAAGCFAAGESLFSRLNEYREGKEIYRELSESVREEGNGNSIPKITETAWAADPGPALQTRGFSRSSMNFEKLRDINPDVRGWIRLNGTNVDYPVMQSANNDFYLSHAVTGVWNKVGTPFIDFRNSGDFSDRLTVIYGHFMDDGSMFTDIHKYKSQRFFEEHPVINLYTPDGDYEILPVAGVYQNVEYWDFQFDYESDEDFIHQIDNWKAVSTFKSDMEYSASDRFTVLTLCTYDIENGRFFLIGKLLSI